MPLLQKACSLGTPKRRAVAPVAMMILWALTCTHAGQSRGTHTIMMVVKRALTCTHIRGHTRTHTHTHMMMMMMMMMMMRAFTHTTHSGAHIQKHDAWCSSADHGMMHTAKLTQAPLLTDPNPFFLTDHNPPLNRPKPPS